MNFSIMDVKHNMRKGESRNGWSKKEVSFADIIVDGQSLYDLFSEKGYDLIPCLGWSFKELQLKEIDRLLLKDEPDLDDNRYSLYVCPECGDLGCGCISLRIERNGDIVIWKDFGFEDNLGISELQVNMFRNFGPFYFLWDNYKMTIENSYMVGDTY